MMADLTMYEVRGYGREESSTETRREGDELVTVKTVTKREQILRLRGVIVPCADDDGACKKALVTSSDEGFLRNIRGVAFRNLSLGKDNRTYWLMADGSELDDYHDQVPGEPERWGFERVVREVTE